MQTKIVTFIEVKEFQGIMQPMATTFYDIHDIEAQAKKKNLSKEQQEKLDDFMNNPNVIGFILNLGCDDYDWCNMVVQKHNKRIAKLLENYISLQDYKLPKSNFPAILKNNNVVKSTSEAIRLIKQRAIKVNGVVIDDSFSLEKDNEYKIQVGKKIFIRFQT
jgi:ribosomal protein S13